MGLWRWTQLVMDSMIKHKRPYSVMITHLLGSGISLCCLLDCQSTVALRLRIGRVWNFKASRVSSINTCMLTLWCAYRDMSDVDWSVCMMFSCHTGGSYASWPHVHSRRECNSTWRTHCSKQWSWTLWLRIERLHGKLNLAWVFDLFIVIPVYAY